MEAENLLMELGWPDYERRAYLALLSLGEASASQIARRADIPRNKSYEALSSLVRKGHVLEISGRPMLFRSAGPETIARGIESERERLASLAEQAKGALSRLAQMPPIQDLVWIMKGQQASVERIAREMRIVKNEALACTRASREDPHIFRDARSAIKRGATVRILGALTEENLSAVREWILLGAEYRVYDTERFGPHGLRFSVFDAKSCRITIGKPEIPLAAEYLTIWSESRSLVSSFRRQFFWMWEQCRPAQESELFQP